ncbi:MAG TPA: hypothetical protein VGE94_19355, partial [Chloroflexota bacterium]
PCADGCPSCMHLTGCPRGNSSLDKVGGLALLQGRAVGGARVAERLLRRPAPRPPTDFDAPARQQRLRAIADADRRERYGGRPTWLEVGGLAQHATEGVVIVWSVARGTAEVQSLSGGESHWVKLSDLSPPRAT